MATLSSEDLSGQRPAAPSGVFAGTLAWGHAEHHGAQISLGPGLKTHTRSLPPPDLEMWSSPAGSPHVPRGWAQPLARSQPLPEDQPHLSTRGSGPGVDPLSVLRSTFPSPPTSLPGHRVQREAFLGEELGPQMSRCGGQLWPGGPVRATPAMLDGAPSGSKGHFGSSGREQSSAFHQLPRAGGGRQG